ncbi:MAG: ABC transporter ATP-binding protein [Bacteroidetes bacterium SW_9_63_38]|nr:MAG: ABC transporter ATP-binding protein [Bacteroidetes bacterium SW_9_63_38]
MAEIDVRDIRHVYEKGTENETVAIKRVNLTLEDGTANALLGPSGCGKTTLLQIISGLLTPTDGQILIDGEDVTDQSPAERDVAQVFQFPVIYDSMSVYGNLAFPLRNSGVPEDEIRDRVHYVADLLDLEDILQDSPAGLGPEMNQLIALGRGIIREETSAILFDEPMTDVEPYRKLTIRRRVKEAQREFGITALYVTHDQHEALTFADKVAIMDVGELVQYDTGQNLYENPTNTFIGHFIGSPGMNLFDCGVGESNGVPYAELGGHSITVAEKLHSRIDPSWTDCQLGIRPNSVEVAFEEPADTSEYVPASVNQVELHSGFQIATAVLEGSDVEVKARVAHDDPVDDGDFVWLKFPGEDVRLFHKQESLEAA